ncbi:MAG: imidazole glycerol phosphate synthase subunit HisH [Gammaproteobacteria bacterium]|nr:imidazole glycerol phosphate synthase subunit HisH [Gammaproteobacteria bacterium]
MRRQVAVIDYGMGNLHSVAKALEHADPAVEVVVTADPVAIRAAERVVLPGVGAIRDCLGEMARLDLIGVITEVATEKPFLGVCVGMQALLTESEENGGTAALGLIPGRVRRFPENLRNSDSRQILKVPHMGWNQVEQLHPHPLWEGIAQQSRFYFVHSYYVQPEIETDSAAVTTHGLRFTAAISNGNLFAVQFHPEKSQEVGLRLYQNFIRWDGSHP